MPDSLSNPAARASNETRWFTRGAARIVLVQVVFGFGWSLYLLAMHFIDVYWAIMPEAHSFEGDAVGVITSLLLTAGMVGLYAGGMLWYTRANNVKVLPVRDPRLAESLAFENI